MSQNAAGKSLSWLNVSLWIAQILLAVFFLQAAGPRLLRSTADFAAAGMALPAVLPLAVVRFASVMELAGAIGVLLPAATRILPFLTPLAALGLAIEQALVLALHTTRGEQTWPINLPLIALSLFVAWGRWKGAPIAAR